MPVLFKTTGVEQLLLSAVCLVQEAKSAHQVFVVIVPSLVISSSCARDCVFRTRDMLRMMAQENLMCSSRPTVFFHFFDFFKFVIFFIFLN